MVFREIPREPIRDRVPHSQPTITSRISSQSPPTMFQITLRYSHNRNRDVVSVFQPSFGSFGGLKLLATDRIFPGGDVFRAKKYRTLDTIVGGSSNL